MFTSTAFAQAAGGTAGGGFDIVQLAPLILIFVVFYFLLLRPQQKKAKEHRTMLSALRRGDRVVTGGGIIGTVSKVQNDEEVVLEIAEGVRVRVVRSTITSVLGKPEAAAEKDKGDKEKAEEAKK